MRDDIENLPIDYSLSENTILNVPAQNTVMIDLVAGEKEPNGAAVIEYLERKRRLLLAEVKEVEKLIEALKICYNVE